MGTIPASEPAINILSPVITYLIGRRPLRSSPAHTHLPSVIANAAGPSQGSITELQYSYIAFQSSLTLMEFTASGTSIVFAIGADLPARTIVSNTASKAAESDDPDGTIGFISSPHSPKFLEIIRIS